MLIHDSHCHLESIQNFSPQFCLIPGINLNDIQELYTARCQYPGIKIGFGLHPWYISDNVESLMHTLVDGIKKFKPDFIGEIGLDYLKPLRELQKELFTQQLAIANDFNLPVVIHCVQAYNDVVRMLSRHHRGIIHAFNANAEMARQFIARGFLLGIGSMIDKNSKIAHSIKDIDLDHIVFESDAPFMPAFGRTKSASSDTFLYAQITAKKLNINLIDLIEQSNNNLQLLFK